jgi:hypothetical protein
MSSSCKASHAPGPAIIEDGSGASLSGLLDPSLDSPPPVLPVGNVLPTQQPSNAAPMDLSTISSQLISLARAIGHLSPPPTEVLPPSPIPMDAPSLDPTSETPAKPPQLLSTISCDTIIRLIHREGSDLPSVCPCDTANASDMKTH